jgi:NAD-dependent deacetylase
MWSGMNDDDLQSLDELRHWVTRARRIVAFTGAGISTECGVPDFRSPGSPWLVNKPIPYQAFVASEDVRREAWRRKFVMDDHYRSAQPGRGHAALAALYARGTLTCIVTQNIDDLHQRSGVPAQAVVELHGNGTYATCLDCGLRHELGPIRTAFEQTGEAPRCMACDGPVKSATVSFGQTMPQGAMRRAGEAVASCDLLLVIGSSLVVHPAARFPVLAKQSGALLALLNREPTPLDSEADLILRGDIGDRLSSVIAP